MQKSSVGLLRSLLYQMFREHPETAALPERNEPLPDWTEKRLKKIFQSITRDLSSSYRMCFFIDGLDEVSGDQDTLITIIQELILDVNIKVVLSSRPYPTFDRAFSSRAMLRLQDLTKADIRKFVSDQLLAFPRLQSMTAQDLQNVPDAAISMIIDVIVWKADGVFLWVELAVKDQIRGINEEDSLEQLRERLRILPTTLEELYAHMLNKIHKAHWKEAAWFLRFALQADSDTLLDFTLGVYPQLDHDLGSSVHVPVENVISHCQRTRRRIITTCAGLLEVHEVGAYADSDSEFGAVAEDEIHVTFLHRTVTDFMNESERGRDFLDRNTTTNRNIFEVWAKVLVARARVLGIHPDEEIYSRFHILGSIMEAVYDAECETGQAQTAVCDYIERAMEILDLERGNQPSESHWCLRIIDWASEKSNFDWQEHLEWVKSDGFFSPSNQVERQSFSRLVSEFLIDYLGFVASKGLKLYVEQQIKSLSADSRVHTADYLLCCAMCSYSFDCLGRSISGPFDLAGTLLKYGGNPNTQAFGSTVWGLFLAKMFQARHHRELDDPEIFTRKWGKLLDSFLKHGADTCGILCNLSWGYRFQVSNGHLDGLLDASPELRSRSGRWCESHFRINMSVPTLIRYCLCDSPASAEMLSFCRRNGALPFAKCTELSFALDFPISKKKKDTWILSEQQSDRLLKAYESSIIPTETPSPSTKVELERQVLLLHDELSAREPDRSSYYSLY